MGLWVNSSHQTSSMQYFIFTPTESVCIWWPFCIDVLSQHYARRMFMRTGNSVASKVVHPVTREKGGKDQAIWGMEGTGRVIPPLSGSRTSGLRWGEVVSPKFPLIPEAHLPALTVHNGSLISALWWNQSLFMLQLSSLAIHCHASCPYMNSASVFSLVREKIKQSRTMSLIKRVKFLLWLAAHLIGALIQVFLVLKHCCHLLQFVIPTWAMNSLDFPELTFIIIK